MSKKDYQVVAEHRASFPYSIELKVGDTVTITEKEEDGWVWCISEAGLGVWVPRNYLKQEGDKANALIRYISTELNVKVDERLTCSKEANGWLWCINQKGERGWVPKTKLIGIRNEPKNRPH